MAQGAKELTTKIKRSSWLVKGTPSKLLYFACIATIDELITIFEALGKKDGSF